MLSYACYTIGEAAPATKDTVEICRQDSQRLCAVLADGLGGHGGGKAASSAAVQTILQGWRGKTSLGELRQLAGRANRQVLSLQTQKLPDEDHGGRPYWWRAPGGSGPMLGTPGCTTLVEGNLLWQTKDHSSFPNRGAAGGR